MLWIRSIASHNFYHGTILSSGKIYVTNSDNDSVSVINTTDDKKTSHDISIGHNPVNIASNRVTGMVYVVNGGSNTVSVTDGHSDKVAAGVIFNVSPGNSGTITCSNKEYPTNTFIYVDNGTSCIAQGKNNFKFDRWFQNLNRNSSIPLDESSGILMVDRYGTFTANFKPLPPPIPPEYSFLIVSVIISSLIGWSMPTNYCWLV